jgi:hypothetical protein
MNAFSAQFEDVVPDEILTNMLNECAFHPVPRL